MNNENTTAIRILVVDDEAMVRELLFRVLTEEKFQVELAGDVPAALKILQARRDFSLIISDVHMPGVDGVDFAGSIRKLGIPVIMLTANPTQDNVQKSIQAGVSDFILKGAFQVDDFVKRIRKHLENLRGGKEREAEPHATSAIQAKPPRHGAALPKLLSLNEIEKRIGGIKEIDALPFVPAEILQLTSDVDSCAKELTSLIARDQSIASKVLRVSNSAFYRSKSRVRNLEQAVLNIGFHGIRDIALAVAIVDRFKGESNGLDRIELWKHSLAVAVLAKNLARRIGYEQPETAFLAGLLHDLGVIFFDEYFNAEYSQAMPILRSHEGIPGNLELEMLGMDHAGLGKRVLDFWNLPEKFRDIVAFHHYTFERLMNFKSKDRTLMALVVVADEIAQAMPFSRQEIEIMDRLDNRWFEFLGIQSADLLREICEQSPQEVYDLLSILLLHQTDPAPLVATSPPVADHGQRLLYVIDESNMTYNPISLRFQNRYCVQKCGLKDIEIPKTCAVFYYVDTEEQAKMAPEHLTRLRVERGLEKPVYILAHASLRPLLSSYQQKLHPILYWPIRAAKIDRIIDADMAEAGTE